MLPESSGAQLSVKIGTGRKFASTMSSSDSESSETSVAGDYVGVESCIDLRNADDFETYARDCAAGYEGRQIRKSEEESANRLLERKKRQPEEFPPPMAQVPWVMKRYYTDDGRLIIREEKASHHHDYFRAHRSNGRLRLQLIPMGDGDEYVDDDDSADSVEDDFVGKLKIEENGDVEFEKIGDELEEALVSASSETGKLSALVSSSSAAAATAMVSSLSMSALCISEGGGGVKNVGHGGGGVYSGGGGGGGKGPSNSGGGGAKKCYGFPSLRSSSASSLFDLQVPAIRPIIS